MARFFEVKKDNYEINISEGDEIIISIPPAVFKNKIKDKICVHEKRQIQQRLSLSYSFFPFNARSFSAFFAKSCFSVLGEDILIVPVFFLYSPGRNFQLYTRISCCVLVLWYERVRV